MKGVAVSAAAAFVCYWIWSSAREWAQGVAAGSDAFLAGSLESLLAGIAGVVSMPVLLWAGMRATGERGNHLLVVAGAVVWPFLGGHLVEDGVNGAGTTVFLVLFAVLCGALSLVEVPRR
ncbi:hypothetical protein GCM10018793_46130 [Streptomyces sulfonofaciens]|uniref:Uncharacterized protein n=1 Tax=Streptomyces sulfonofaciens TaxID=68272 RepID=A0A919L4F2_9ACTN|nr:hypothetical protein GCM10018793_46130 [Streptomyces sulfonofaciens]